MKTLIALFDNIGKKDEIFSLITDSDLVTIMDKFNNRQRKSLVYATPNEIFNKIGTTQ